LFGFLRGEQNELYDAWCDDWRKPPAKKSTMASKKKESEEENGIEPNPEVDDETPAAVKLAAKKKTPSKKKAPALAKETVSNEPKEAEESAPAAMAAKRVAKKEAASKKKSPVVLVGPEEQKGALATKPVAERKASTSKKAADAECVARMPPPEAEEDTSEMEDGSKKPSEWTVFGFSRDEQNQLFDVWCEDWRNPKTKKRKTAENTKATATSMENEVAEEKEDEAPASAKGTDPNERGEAEESPPLSKKTPSLKKKTPATARNTQPENEEEGEVSRAVKPDPKKKTSSRKKALATAKGS
jgi:hypothetical protein